MRRADDGIRIRASSVLVRLIDKAAELERMSRSEFVRHAAFKKAVEVIRASTLDRQHPRVPDVRAAEP